MDIFKLQNIIHETYYFSFFLGLINLYSQTSLEQQIRDIEPKVIEWRRHFHQNPELSNREFKTSEKIAKHLKSLNIEV